VEQSCSSTATEGGLFAVQAATEKHISDFCSGISQQRRFVTLAFCALENIYIFIHHKW